MFLIPTYRIEAEEDEGEEEEEEGEGRVSEGKNTMLDFCCMTRLLI